MTLLDFLNVYGPVALTVFALGTGYKVARHLYLIATRRRPMGPTPSALDAPEPMPWGEALKRAVFYPILRFPRRSNKLWTLGFTLYHVGIIMTTAGYLVSMIILAVHLLLGHPIPDVARGLAESHNTSVPNLVAIIFGNAEPLVARFLFGPLAGAFVAITWVDVLSAFTGNLLMLVVRARRLSGAITAPLDPYTESVRRPGRRRFGQVAVTLVITGIIWTEILARLQLVEHIVLVHSVFGLTLLLVLPFSYLWHMFYIWVAMFYMAARWRRHQVA